MKRINMNKPLKRETIPVSGKLTADIASLLTYGDEVLFSPNAHKFDPPLASHLTPLDKLFPFTNPPGWYQIVGHSLKRYQTIDHFIVTGEDQQVLLVKGFGDKNNPSVPGNMHYTFFSEYKLK